MESPQGEVMLDKGHKDLEIWWEETNLQSNYDSKTSERLEPLSANRKLARELTGFVKWVKIKTNKTQGKTLRKSCYAQKQLCKLDLWDEKGATAIDK